MYTSFLIFCIKINFIKIVLKLRFDYLKFLAWKNFRNKNVRDKVLFLSMQLSMLIYFGGNESTKFSTRCCIGVQWCKNKCIKFPLSVVLRLINSQNNCGQSQEHYLTLFISPVPENTQSLKTLPIINPEKTIPNPKINSWKYESCLK